MISKWKPSYRRVPLIYIYIYVMIFCLLYFVLTFKLFAFKETLTISTKIRVFKELIDKDQSDRVDENLPRNDTFSSKNKQFFKQWINKTELSNTQTALKRSPYMTQSGYNDSQATITKNDQNYSTGNISKLITLHDKGKEEKKRITTINRPINDKTATNKYQRKDNCTNCNQHNFNMVIQNDQICAMKSGKDAVDILILIMTVHENIKNRNAIRNTWLNISKNNTAPIRYVFLLGEIKDKNKQNAVLEESKIYHDIIKEDFVDSYANLTHKTIMGLKWASTKCSHAHFVMKTDDDMFVNVPNLLQLVKTQGDILKTAVGGHCEIKASPIRDSRSKWFASVDSYPGTNYPGFCHGGGHITSMDVARKVFEVSSNVPFFHLEDVYVALCIRALGFHLHPFEGFRSDRPRLDPCLYKGSKTLITAHQLDPHNLQFVWTSRCDLSRSKDKNI